jgi:sugar O-acyltransferase (sialic acid O-acetyltransferase NeuD family)
MSKPVILYGSRKLGKMLYYDSENNPNFDIAVFTVDKEFLNEDGCFLGLPQIDLDKVLEEYPSDKYDMIALIAGYNNMRDREKMYYKAKDKGYVLRNYISSSCEIASDVIMGDNNLIFGQTHIGFSGVMGNSNTIRQQTYLGHEFIMGDYNVITPDCRIGGECRIGNSCYIGIGATIKNGLVIANETLVGAGSVVVKDTEESTVNVGIPSRILRYHKDTGIQIEANHG